MNLIPSPAGPIAFGSLGETLVGLSRSMTASSDLTDKGTAAVETLSAAYVAEALKLLGWQWDIGRRFTGWQMMRDLGILPQYDRLVMRLLGKFEEDGVIA